VLTTGPPVEERAAEVLEDNPTGPTTVSLDMVEPESVGETVSVSVAVLYSVTKLLVVPDPGV
jgi:hypothetical protein